MPTSSSLKSARARDKRALIKEESEAQKLLQENLPSNPEDALRLQMAVGKVLLNLETKFSRLELANEKVIDALEQADDSEGTEQFQNVLDEEAEVMDNVLTRISEVKVLKDELERVRKNFELKSKDPHTSQTTPTDTSDATIAHIWSPPDVHTTIKPPKLEIVPFDGNILKWREFWDAFEASIDKGRYSPVDKMTYLKSKLIGEALDAISGYQLSHDNYAAVVDVLKRRFGNTQLIIDAHYRALSHLAVASNQLGKLRQCYDTIECHLRSLEALGENIEHRHFVSLITDKLPQEVLYQLYLMKGEESWTVQKLRMLLEKHITAMEMAGADFHLCHQLPSTKMSSKPGHLFEESRRPPLMSRPTAGELLVGGSSNIGASSRRTVKCVFCSGTHWSDECTEHTSLQARMEKLRGSCFKCLQKGHMAKDCQRQRACFHCSKNNHHRSLCPKLFPATTDQTSETGSQSGHAPSTDEESQNEAATVACGNQVLMQSATTSASNKSSSKSMSVRMILDSGSQRTYITQKLAENLQLKLNQPETVTVVTFGSDKPKQIKYRLTELRLALKDGSSMLIEASVVPHITGRISRAPINSENVTFLKSKEWETKLADTLPTDSEDTSVELLIGNDYYFDLLLPRKMELGDGLFLFQSKLGWILGGRYFANSDSTSTPSLLVGTPGIAPEGMKTTAHMFSNVDSSLVHKPNLDIFWNLESIGIVDSPLNTDDKRAMEIFNNTVKFDNGRYLVSWPWKESNPLLPENYQLAVGRLKSTLNKLKRNPKLLGMYSTVITEQLERGIIEKVPSNCKQVGVKHYIPHHAVITPTKSTTKIRIVYDASAKTKQTNNSLNDCLLRGPVMLPDLCGLLMRFRLCPIAVIADVEKAFLNIGLHDRDRDVTRFLWLKNPEHELTEQNLEVFRFCRVPFGIISSPFLLAATINHHLQQSDQPIAKEIQQNLYVDNLISGVDTVERAESLYRKAKNLFSGAAMNIREWASNSNQFMDLLPPEDRNANCRQKVLGVNWNLVSDELSLSIPSACKLNVSTKRKALQAIASVFDPLGFFAPTILEAKLFMKELWVEKCDWDTQLDAKQLAEWLQISKHLESIPLYRIPRHIGNGNKESTEYSLICFCDASSKAYATVIYLHQSLNDTCKTDLIFSKTRLAPDKITIPRLELLGVLIGVRALKFVSKELHLQISYTVVFTDSLCVLHWLQTKKPLSPFITNRLKEIRMLNDATFQHIPTAENSADMATRGKPPEELSSMWWNGPSWLAEPKEQWPNSKTPELDIKLQEQFDVELRDKGTGFEADLVAGESSFHLHKSILIDIDEKKYSSLFKLLRVTAYVLRFVDKLKKRDHRTGPLSAKEIEIAKLLWEKNIQSKSYPDILDRMQKGKKSNIIHQLNLQLDSNGLVRCHGRFGNAELTQGARFPKLLPKDEYFTELVINDVHAKILHSGVSQTLATIRQVYWIPQGRAAVKKVLSNCRICKRTEGHPFSMPPMPDIPRERVARSLPFDYTGLDYFGPLYVKNFAPDTIGQNDGQNSKKVWVCLFTCMTIRAIHLELVDDMSADEFLLSFRRFVARRGTPRWIISDNAQQFKCASTTLSRAWKDVIKDEKVCDFSSKRFIKWNFIVELAPWMGGFYERLVGLTKRALRKTIGTRSLTQRQLSTILTEVEAVINSRPLVYVDSDLNSNIALTPSHFLSLHSNCVIPDLTEEIDPEFDASKIVSSSQQLLEIWKRGQKLLNQFWNVWRQEYLSSLRERSQASLKGPRSNTDCIPKVGEVVLVKENLPRGYWKVGRICELFQSRDKRIRSARITFGPNKFVNRALSYLYPIECPDEKVTDNSHSSQVEGRSDDNVNVSDCDSNDKVANVMSTTRPTRQASIEARQRLKQWLNPHSFDDTLSETQSYDSLSRDQPSKQTHLCGECRNTYCE